MFASLSKKRGWLMTEGISQHKLNIQDDLLTVNSARKFNIFWKANITQAKSRKKVHVNHQYFRPSGLTILPHKNSARWAYSLALASRSPGRPKIISKKISRTIRRAVARTAVKCREQLLLASLD
jgi:hypothetical protein